MGDIIKTIVSWWNIIPMKWQLFIFILGGLSIVIGFIYNKKLTPEQKKKLKAWLTSGRKVLKQLDVILDKAEEWLKENREFLSKYLSVDNAVKVCELLDELVEKVCKEIEQTGIVVSDKNKEKIAQKLVDLTPINTEGLKVRKVDGGFKIDYRTKI